MDVWREYAAARLAVDRLKRAVDETPDLLKNEDPDARKHLKKARENLEGTYIVRLFATFEAALRSYDRARHDDPSRNTKASTMIAQIGGKKVHDIPTSVRDGADQVRRVRNYWAHESDDPPYSMTIDEARARLQRFLSELPEKW